MFSGLVNGESHLCDKITMPVSYESGGFYISIILVNLEDFIFLLYW